MGSFEEIITIAPNGTLKLSAEGLLPSTSMYGVSMPLLLLHRALRVLHTSTARCGINASGKLYGKQAHYHRSQISVQYSRVGLRHRLVLPRRPLL